MKADELKRRMKSISEYTNEDETGMAHSILRNWPVRLTQEEANLLISNIHGAFAWAREHSVSYQEMAHIKRQRRIQREEERKRRIYNLDHPTPKCVVVDVQPGQYKILGQTMSSGALL